MQKDFFRIGLTSLIFLLLTINIVSADVSFDRSDLKNGVLKVKTNENADKKVKLVIEKGNFSVTYDVLKYNEFENFALTAGNGLYKVEVYKHLEGKNYKRIVNTTVSLDVADENKVFTQSTQEIAFKVNSEPILYAKGLVKDAKTDEEKVEILYNYMIREYNYNSKKVSSVDDSYIPDIEKVFAEKNGICYDFSVLFAAMLRSNGIATKLVKGYTEYMPGRYHSWNEVYVDGKWMVIDTSMDANRYQNILDFEMEKEASKYTKSLEF